MKLIHVLVILFFLALSPLQADEWIIDTAHSSVGFKIRHLGISNVKGSFGEFNGTFKFDKANIEKSAVDANINLTSINTSNQKRDKHLRSCDFFCIDKFAAMKFTSSKVTKKSDKTFQIHGVLDLHGVKKPVVLDAEYLGAAKDDYGNDRIAFSATGKLNRKDYGLKWNDITETGGLLVGEDVMIELEIAAKKAAKKSA